ncbi:MAG: hypothetical protein ACFNYA_06970, partial [Capnocytophaga granulosa]
DIQKPPPTPLQRGNEIVYDSQEVRERTFFQIDRQFLSFSTNLFPLSEGVRGRFILQYIDYQLITNLIIT